MLGLALERLQTMPDEQARLGAAGRRRVMAEYVDDADCPEDPRLLASIPPLT